MAKSSSDLLNNLQPEPLKLVGKIKEDPDDQSVILFQYIVNASNWIAIPIKIISRIEETRESSQNRGEYPVANVYIRKPRHRKAKLFHDVALSHVETSPRPVLVTTAAGPMPGCYYDEAVGRLRCPPDYN